MLDPGPRPLDCVACLVPNLSVSFVDGSTPAPFYIWPLFRSVLYSSLALFDSLSPHPVTKTMTNVKEHFKSGPFSNITRYITPNLGMKLHDHFAKSYSHIG